MITKLSERHAPLAQLDRASGYGPEGRGFESLTAYHPEIVGYQRFQGFFFLRGEGGWGADSRTFSHASGRQWRSLPAGACLRPVSRRRRCWRRSGYRDAPSTPGLPSNRSPEPAGGCAAMPLRYPSDKPEKPIQQGLSVIWQGFSSVSRPGNRAAKRSYGRRCCRNGKIPFGRAVSSSPKGHFFCKEEMSFLLCKSIAKNKMRHFLAPSGQPRMMRKNFMRSGFAHDCGAQSCA